MNTKEECKYFETCSAALCPKDPHPKRYWYVGTDICKFSDTDWVKTQKKIQALKPPSNQYYTEKMLKSIGRVSKDITGLVCDGYSEWREQEWLKEYKKE